MKKYWLNIYILGICVLAAAVYFYISGSEEKPRLTANGIGLEDFLYSNNTICKGKGVTIAVIDSGLSKNSKINASRILAFKDFVGTSKINYDDSNHGTAVTEIIGADGSYKGLASKCNFVIIKVLDEDGTAYREDLVKALNWTIENMNTYNIRIINLSLGVTTMIPYNLDTLYEPIKTLYNKGITIISSSGNDESVTSPSIFPEVISVGAFRAEIVNDRIIINNFSKAEYDINKDLRKPDIYTFGYGIKIPDMDRRLDGTSYSTAVITGFCATLLERYKNISPDEVRNKLINYSSTVNGKIVLNPYNLLTIEKPE